MSVEGETRTDEKKRKRMISNRESARRSRKKKQQLTEDLINEIEKLKKENHDLVTRIDGIKQRRVPIERENGVLMDRKSELTERLNHLNNIIIDDEEKKKAIMNVDDNDRDLWPLIEFGFEDCEGFEEFSIDFSDSVFRSWQPYCTSQQHPIMASSASMFQF